MAKAVTSLPSGLTIALGFLGRHGNNRGSVAQQVHDGDTIIVEAAGNLSVRFLGIDTPEVSFTLPESRQFLSIAGEDWNHFLADPFSSAPEGFVNSLGDGLRQHLQTAVGAGCAANHAYHANNAHRLLEQLVDQDMQLLGQDRETFKFFMAFAHEIMDRYGRFLCFINRYQETDGNPEPRPKSYNERMLQAGMACPYFIWPNINPFRREPSLANAVPLPGAVFEIAHGLTGLGPARQWISTARQDQRGIFETGNLLRLEPFELRFLSRQAAPNRWVIDLSRPNTNTLLHPVNYHQIHNAEDRLFIPAEHVPLFLDKGWQREQV
jgi:endonuclease YncB( thermonuclease family)